MMNADDTQLPLSDKVTDLMAHLVASIPGLIARRNHEAARVVYDALLSLWLDELTSDQRARITVTTNVHIEDLGDLLNKCRSVDEQRHSH